ncbi:prepilin-type N-terminal cleavage/methylation domain-containing protein [Vibrio ordalii]|uniref:pilin n=1 Tax=Vibrio ordalii TaxID=28174 RepID=UPI002578834F|nr:prepilin-type N-terminal cleavage/methylation domain-containing protein [Vibrio ordalii]MCS0353231.1 prepilin-type N-terminal cleavage/methylation domain-containing protein [Vibrio ordalii]
MNTKKKTKQSGFTLIELMIVVAVIGVLAAIAVPKYQEYVEKGALGAALATATALKTNYEDYIAVSGTPPANSAAINATKFNLGSITVTSGAITVSITEGGGKGSSVTLNRASGGWQCNVSASSTNIKLNGCS